MVASPSKHPTLSSYSPLSDGRPVPCVVMRGGTSRGLFFHEHDLPRNPRLRDRVIMGAVGAPDPRQVDGLGGADMLLSKVAIISRPFESGTDLECEFANVTPGKDRPTYGTNCGNLISAVALFGIDEGLISPTYQDSVIRIRNRNSGDIIEARIGSLAGESANTDVTTGMSDTGVCVDLDFIDPVGTVRNLLLPTGRARESISLKDGRTVDYSVVDAGALYVFVRANDLDLSATETAHQMRRNAGAATALEEIRSAVAEKTGVVEAASQATKHSPDVPKIACVGPRQSYRCNDGSVRIDADRIDLVSRIVSSQNYHHAYAVTGGIATAAAAAVPNSVVQEAAGKEFASGMNEIRIGHPSGTMTCRFESHIKTGAVRVSSAGLTRTARRIMQGTVVVPNRCFA